MSENKHTACVNGCEGLNPEGYPATVALLDSEVKEIEARLSSYRITVPAESRLRAKLALFKSVLAQTKGG